MNYRAHSRARVALATSALVALALTGCATAESPAIGGEQPTSSSTPVQSVPTPEAEESSTPTPDAEPATSVWPASWPSEVPHPTSGVELYSNSERDAIYKIGLSTTPDAFDQLVTEFTAAGYADQADQGENDGEHTTHNFTKGEWRVILKGAHTDQGFEMHYIGKRV